MRRSWYNTCKGRESLSANNPGRTPLRRLRFPSAQWVEQIKRAEPVTVTLRADWSAQKQQTEIKRVERAVSLCRANNSLPHDIAGDRSSYGTTH